MRLFAFVLFGCLLALPDPACAQMSGTYVGFGMGGWDKKETGTYSSNDYSTVLNVFAGLRMSFLRAEFNISQWDNATREGYTDSFTAASAAVYLHIMPGSTFSPFIGGGGGYLISDEGNSPFYTYGGGIEISPRYAPVGVSVEYRHLEPTKKIKQHDFTANAYLFNIFYNF